LLKYVLILAAGKGTRMNSDLPKVLHEVAFHPMLDHVLSAAETIKNDGIFTVVGHGCEKVEAVFADKTSFVLQKEQKGTGHAVKVAMESVFDDKENGTVLILCGDTPLLRGETLTSLIASHEANGNLVTVLTASLAHPFGYGRIIRDQNDRICRIVEEKDASDAEKAVQEINSGVYCFDLAFLKKAVGQLANNNSQGEFYLTDTIAICRESGGDSGAYHIDDFEEVKGINDRVQLAEAAKILRRRKAESLMKSGVSLIDPDTTWIDVLAEIGHDTIVEPFSIIKGKTVIGKNCHIGPNAELTDAVLGDQVTFWRSVAKEAQIGDFGNIGPFAYLRPGTVLADHVKVGDFVEVKNSNIGSGTKMPHLTYVGDSDIGDGCNIACGTITCNYDGFKKSRTTIGDGAFIGCNVNLVAPIDIEDGAYIGAGSTITKDVPEDALAVARKHQTNVEGWAARFRKLNKK
jgi:bifunctional UDP-N-acetylglucosamine pyrophosphorylase/glucosamine-1-phosphate N-acetyltransferase